LKHVTLASTATFIRITRAMTTDVVAMAATMKPYPRGETLRREPILGRYLLPLLSRFC